MALLCKLCQYSLSMRELSNENELRPSSRTRQSKDHRNNRRSRRERNYTRELFVRVSAIITKEIVLRKHYCLSSSSFGDVLILRPSMLHSTSFFERDTREKTLWALIALLQVRSGRRRRCRAGKRSR